MTSTMMKNPRAHIINQVYTLPDHELWQQLRRYTLMRIPGPGLTNHMFPGRANQEHLQVKAWVKSIKINHGNSE